MYKYLLLTTTAVVVGFGSPAEAQNRGIRYGTANSTPYMAQRFPVAPRYVQQFGGLAARRYYAPTFRPYIPQGAYGILRGGGPIGAGVMYFTNPSTAYAPGVATGTATTSRPFYGPRR